MGIWEGILSAVGLIAIGWYAHAFFHRRKLDDLHQKVRDFEANESQIANVEGHNKDVYVEAIDLNEDEVKVLHVISHNSSDRPRGWSHAKMGLVRGRLSGHGLIVKVAEDDYTITRLGLEWLDAAGLIDE